MKVRALRDNVHLLGLSSIEDVEHALEKAGYQEDDIYFVVTETSSPSADELYHIYSTVQTTHKASGKTRTYNSGHNSTWAFEFERDLKSGFYK